MYSCAGIFRGGRFEPAAELCVDGDGRVVAKAAPGAQRVDWSTRLLVPGLVNAHSHAFQRVIRARTEFLNPGHAEDDFWTWRELMYRAANALTPEGVYVASRQAFLEMALAGITTVGEFHYLHHQSDGRPYDDVHLLAREVIRAARDIGLRIVLLRVGYARAGFEVAPNPLQRRFIEPDVETWFSRAAELARLYAHDDLVTVGLAPHSVRAVPKEWLTFLGRRSEQPLTHLHVAEQPKEIERCLAEHSLRPVELLADTGVLHARTTAVHAIHLNAAEIELMKQRGATVCACPSTEANLGDGTVAADALMQAGIPVALGSDSQAQIDLLMEARQLEAHLRLQRGRRVVLAPRNGGADSLGERLLDCATRVGAQSLGLKVGTLREGEPADFCTVDLGHASLLGVPAQHWSSAVALAADAGAVRDVAVQGQLIVCDGQHTHAESCKQAYTVLMKDLFS